MVKTLKQKIKENENSLRGALREIARLERETIKLKKFVSKAKKLIAKQKSQIK